MSAHLRAVSTLRMLPAPTIIFGACFYQVGDDFNGLRIVHADFKDWNAGLDKRFRDKKSIFRVCPMH